MWTATGRNTHVLGRRTAIGPNGSFGKFNMFGAHSGRDRSSVPDQFRPGPIFRFFKRRQVLATTAAARPTELLTASALSTCGRDISSRHIRRPGGRGAIEHSRTLTAKPYINLTFRCLFGSQVLGGVSCFWALCKNGLQMAVAKNMNHAYFSVTYSSFLAAWRGVAGSRYNTSTNTNNQHPHPQACM